VIVDQALIALHVASVGLGALWSLTVLANAFNKLIAIRWPRFAAVLSGLGGHIGAAREGLAEAEKALEAMNGVKGGGL
jgi:hypothetical protein